MVMQLMVLLNIRAASIAKYTLLHFLEPSFVAIEVFLQIEYLSFVAASETNLISLVIKRVSKIHWPAGNTCQLSSNKRKIYHPVKYFW